TDFFLLRELRLNCKLLDGANFKSKTVRGVSKIYFKHNCCVKLSIQLQICRRTFFLELFDTQALFIQAKWFTKET
ncbi:MAG: hypothetical protein ACK55I_40350, partial [bacterium]